ncbi:SPASM domain-containing protein [bacterium]|nr:SPASM domain-containing protein [bacterium]
MATICNEILEEVCVLATGDVVCSCVDVEGVFKTGNIKKQGVYEIFRGKRYRELRRILLSSKDNTFCPALGCNCFAKTQPSPGALDPETLEIRKIRLETVSYCNLRCLACKIREWQAFRGVKRPGNLSARAWLRWLSDVAKRRLVRTASRHPRFARLEPEYVERLILDVRKTLRDLWLYNYGEPFLDPQLIRLLRFVRRTVPECWIYTHTNGNVMPRGSIETIVREGLIDHISFSIDGVDQETYGRYRVGGDFDTAFGNMTAFIGERAKLDRDKPRVTWQYILFEWNDSPEAIERVQCLAKEHGLDVQWILTHTEGRSKRLTQDSEEYQRLSGIKHYSGQILAERQDSGKGD